MMAATPTSSSPTPAQAATVMVATLVAAVCGVSQHQTTGHSVLWIVLFGQSGYCGLQMGQEGMEQVVA